MKTEEPRLRLFVALAVPPEIKLQVAAAQQELRGQLPPRSLSWTPLENLHLTLRFLGDVATSRIDALTAALASAVAGFPSLHLTAEGVGCFPNTRSPRVFWIGVREAREQLAALRQQIVAATAGFTRELAEETFIGHITFGRARHIDRRQAEKVAVFVSAATSRRFGEWTTDHVDLMRSELSPGGSRHSCLVELPLR